MIGVMLRSPDLYMNKHHFILVTNLTYEPDMYVRKKKWKANVTIYAHPKSIK